MQYYIPPLCVCAGNVTNLIKLFVFCGFRSILYRVGFLELNKHPTVSHKISLCTEYQKLRVCTIKTTRDSLFMQLSDRIDCSSSDSDNLSLLQFNT